MSRAIRKGLQTLQPWGLTLLIAPWFCPVATAQVVVGYQNQTTTAYSNQVQSSITTAKRISQGVAGSNVQPLGNSDGIFSIDSEWEIRNPGQPFSLRVTNVNPEIRTTETNLNSLTVTGSLNQSLTSTLVGPFTLVGPLTIFGLP